MYIYRVYTNVLALPYDQSQQIISNIFTTTRHSKRFHDIFFELSWQGRIALKSKRSALGGKDSKQKNVWVFSTRKG
jgi:hypothetical protein